MIRALVLLAPIAYAAPRFIGGGAIKMYALELGFLIALFGVTAWAKRS